MCVVSVFVFKGGYGEERSALATTTIINLTTRCSESKPENIFMKPCLLNLHKTLASHFLPVREEREGGSMSRFKIILNLNFNMCYSMTYIVWHVCTCLVKVTDIPPNQCSWILRNGHNRWSSSCIWGQEW